MGAAKFNTSRRGHKPTPVRSFVKALARVYRVFSLSEAYTSKRCWTCSAMLERASATSYRYWFCPHCGIKAKFNKDFGACMAQLRNGMLLATTGKKPAQWCTLEQVYNSPLKDDLIAKAEAAKRAARQRKGKKRSAPEAEAEPGRAPDQERAADEEPPPASTAPSSPARKPPDKRARTDAAADAAADNDATVDMQIDEDSGERDDDDDDEAELEVAAAHVLSDGGIIEQFMQGLDSAPVHAAGMLTHEDMFEDIDEDSVERNDEDMDEDIEESVSAIGSVNTAVGTQEGVRDDDHAGHGQRRSSEARSEGVSASHQQPASELPST